MRERWEGKRWPFIACVVLQTIIFGLGNVLTKFAYDSITPLWCLVFRFGMAFAVFAVFFGPRIVRQLRTVRLRAWVPAAVCMALGYMACNVALAFTTATNVGFLVALPVAFAPLIAVPVLRRCYPKGIIPFQVAIVAGLYLLCCNGGSFSFGWGELLALASAIALAGALVFGEEGLAQLDAVTIAGTQIGMAFALSVVCALALESLPNLAEVQPVAWGTIAFLALLSTCLTFALQNISLIGLPSSTVSVFLTGEPVFTALFSGLWLGEVLTPAGWIGSIVIFAAVIGATLVDGRATQRALPSRAERGARRQHTAPEALSRAIAQR